ncbi:MAG TPA: hypothetical protein VIG50_14840 [Vicinamibacteria bacterium]|jgi:hypothetical protein
MATKTVLAAVAATLIGVPAHAQSAGDKLAFLIPTLYGPTGLTVDSEARLPSGETHSAHFNSAFQAEFTQFNIALASQLAAVPLPSSASGFTYELDPTLGVFQRSTQSFGPILAERAETIGKRKFSVGFSYQLFTFDTLQGVSLDQIPAVFTHDDPSSGGRADVVTTLNSIDARVGQTTAFFTFGLLDNVDLSVAVPFVTVDLDVASEASVQRIGTAGTPAVHFFRDANGGFGGSRRFAATGTASGLGDVILRLKSTVVKSGQTSVAIGVDSRIPTADEEDLLGSGSPGVKPFLALSVASRNFAPHLNVAYQWNGDSVLAGNVMTGEKGDMPDQVLYAAGLDIGLTEKFTIAFDVLGRYVIDSPRLNSTTFRTIDVGSTFPNIHFDTGSFSVVDGAVGLKINLGGKLLADFNALFKLNEAGLRDTFTPLVGIEYSF